MPSKRAGGAWATSPRSCSTGTPCCCPRADLWLDLTAPVTVERPIGEPVVTRRLAIAADEPERLAAALLGDARTVAERRPNRVPGLVALPELVYGSH